MRSPYLSDFDTFAGLAPAKSRLLGRANQVLATSGGSSRPTLVQAIRRPRITAQAHEIAEEVEDAMSEAAARDFELARGNENPMGMDSVAAIGAGLALAVNTIPQKPCVPTRLVVTVAMAATFALQNLTVGVEPILLTNGVNMSMGCFEPAATAPEFRARLAYPGINITATVLNLTGAAARFIATVYAVVWSRPLAGLV